MAISNFEIKMKELGYDLKEKGDDGYKWTYEKKTPSCTLVLVVNLKLQYVHPMMITDVIVVDDSDFKKVVNDFLANKKAAELICELSCGKFKIL